MGKHKLIQRFPNFFSGMTSIKTEFDSVEELEQVPFVARWMSRDSFVRLSLSYRDKKNKSKAILMVENNDGTFWAIAFLKDVEDLKLPEWIVSNFPRKEKEYINNM